MSELSFVVCIIDQTVGILQSFPPEWIQSILGWQLLLLLLSRFSRVQLCATPQTAATRLPRPWDSPGKNTGVGCHFLLQCMKVKSGSEVAQSCPTLRDPMDCSPPGSSVHGICQARVLEGAPLQLPLLKAIFNCVIKLSYSVLSTYYGANASATTNKL